MLTRRVLDDAWAACGRADVAFDAATPRAGDRCGPDARARFVAAARARRLARRRFRELIDPHPSPQETDDDAHRRQPNADPDGPRP